MLWLNWGFRCSSARACSSCNNKACSDCRATCPCNGDLCIACARHDDDTIACDETSCGKFHSIHCDVVVTCDGCGDATCEGCRAHRQCGDCGEPRCLGSCDAVLQRCGGCQDLLCDCVSLSDCFACDRVVCERCPQPCCSACGCCTMPSTSFGASLRALLHSSTALYTRRVLCSTSCPC